MAYRHQKASELCSRCGELGDEACPRCRSPYCEAHAPPGDRRCDPCECEYLAMETRTTRSIVVAPLIVSGAAGFVGVLAVHAARNGFIKGPYAQYAALILYAALGIMALAFALPPLVRWRLRRSFLRQAAGQRECKDRRD